MQVTACRPTAPPRRFYLALIVLSAVGALASTPLVGADAPLAQHPDNPHYFLWRGRPTILITSGEHYGAVLNADFDYRTYLGELARHGLNLTRTFSGVYREVPSSFGITDNPLAPKPGRYHAPWRRSDQPGDFDGGHKFDLRNWDEAYFARLKDFLSEAQRRGVVVEFNLFCPFYEDVLWKASPMNAANNIQGLGNCGREEVYTLKHPDLLEVQLAFVRKVVSELRDFDNLYYEVCNEPYFGGVTVEWQYRVAEAIRGDESQFPQHHLISMNIANGRAKVEKPHPAVSIFNFHYCVPPDTVNLNFASGRVIGENETGFRGRDDILYRTEGWDFLLAGGGLYNNLDYSFTPAHPDGTFLEYHSPGGGSPALRGQLAILKTFLDGFDFLRMAPDRGVVRRVEPELAVEALAERGRAYAIYAHVPLPHQPPADVLHQLADRPVQARLTIALPAGRYRAEWIDTKNGAAVHSDAIQHGGGDRTLVAPEFRVDIALRIHAVK